MEAQELKKQIFKFRKEAFNKLLKAYKIKNRDKEVKVCSRKGEHYILIGEDCWKEVLEFKGNDFNYSLQLNREFFNDK